MFGSAQGDDTYQEIGDLDSSGDIGFRDFVIFAQFFGKDPLTFTPPGGKLALSKAVPGTNTKAAVTLATKAGQEPNQVELVLGLNKARQVLGYHLQLSYDNSALELIHATSVDDASILANHLVSSEGKVTETQLIPVAVQFEVKQGEIRLADIFDLGHEIVGKGDLLKLTFNIIDETLPGQLEISNVLVSDPTGRINELLGARVDLRALPMEYALSQNYPNPFNPDTQIPYQLPEPGEVSLVVYNTLGQQVRVLVNERREAGYHHLTWNGKDEIGRQVASGIYMVRMKAGEYRSVRKMVLLK
jgi:hypothetical protein